MSILASRFGHGVFQLIYQSAPREAEPYGHNHGNERSPSTGVHANPSLIRSQRGAFDHSLVNEALFVPLRPGHE
jgi:hypothetical protein